MTDPLTDRLGDRAAGRPLLVTDRPDLLDDLLRLAAAAGCETEVAAALPQARAGWARAPVVVLADDLVAAALTAGFPRRPGVVVVANDPDDTTVYPRALDLGAEVVLYLPDGEAALVDYLASAANGSAKSGLVLGVVGGRGGAGATTLAVALALAGVRQRLDTVLVDADPLGGGIDLALGAEESPGVRWPDLGEVRGRVAGRALAGALPQIYGLGVLSWDRRDGSDIASAAVAAVFAAARRGSDLVVVDLPRSLTAEAAAMLGQARTTILVLPAEVRAAAAAARVARSVAPFCADLRLVVRGPAPGRLDAATVAAALDLPLAAAVRAEPGLAAAAERGEPPGHHAGPLAKLADTLLADLLGEGAGPGPGPAGRPGAGG